METLAPAFAVDAVELCEEIVCDTLRPVPHRREVQRHRDEAPRFGVKEGPFYQGLFHFYDG